MPRLQQKYYQEIVPTLQKEWGLKHALAVPRISKIVINAGISEETNQKQALANMSEQLIVITGQKPIITQAKKAIANFKIRAGDPIGIKITLRRKRMYQFLDKLISLVLPRVRDFQGIKLNAFDKHGNYSFGFTEQIIFPEVDYDKIDRVRGLQVTFVTNAKTDEKAKRLLELFGLPFEKPAKGEARQSRPPKAKK